MKINRTESQTFGARIVINKKGFSNLAKNIADSGHAGLDTSMSASTNSCASSAPWALKNPIPDKDGYVHPVNELADDLEKRINDIKARNISPSSLEGVTFNKAGYENLGQNSADLSMTTFPSIKLTSSTVLETSAIPSEIEYGKGFWGSILKNWHEIKNMFKQIGQRNVKTVNVDFPEELRVQSDYAARISGNTLSGAGSIATGISSYSGSVALGADNVLYHSNLPESVVGGAKDLEFIKNIHNSYAKNNFTDKSITSSFLSSGGLGMQVGGLEFFKGAGKLIKESRKFPS